MPTLTLNILGGTDDGHYLSGGGAFVDTATTVQPGVRSSDVEQFAWFHFSGVSGLIPGCTINSCVLRVTGGANGAGSPETVISFEKAAAPTAPTSNADGASRVRTTAKADWDVTSALGVTIDSADFTSSLEELLAAYPNPSVLQVWVDNDRTPDTTENRNYFASFENGSYSPAQLIIDYTSPPPKGRGINISLGIGI